MTDRVSNVALLEAGLALLKAGGKTLQKLPTSSRAMKYQLGSGETVRVRTCNDHVLVVLADSAEQGAALNIEGTDHLLIVMPEVPRREGGVVAYFVPVAVAVEAVRTSHAEWLASTPSTKGNNRTWNIWFDNSPATWGGFAQKWAKYRLLGQASTLLTKSVEDAVSTNQSRPLGTVIAEARKEIAAAAGVSIDAVKISVELS